MVCVVYLFCLGVIMKVTVVGTSCSWFTRKNTSYLIDDDIVFDVPEGAYKDLINLTDIMKLKCILISHVHTDHALGLHVITTRYIRENNRRTEPLRIYAPKGFFDLLVQMNKMFLGGDDEFNKEAYKGRVEFIDLEDGMSFTESEYNITAYKMEHGKPETYGFVFTDKKQTSVGFSSDTRICDNLHKLLDKSNHAFVEMAAMKQHPKHICCDEFCDLLKKYPSTKFYPVHTSDETQKFAVDKGLNYLEDGQVLNF